MNWQRVSRNRWRSEHAEIRAVVLAGAVSYKAIDQGLDRRHTWNGIAHSWHLTAASARDWCEAQRQGVTGG